MALKSQTNRLKLSFLPISNREFSTLKKNPKFQSIIKRSKIYIIAQRPELRFDNLIIKNNTLEFEIRQETNPHSLKCKVASPITPQGSKLNIRLFHHDKGAELSIIPANNVYKIQFEYVFEQNHRKTISLTPESFILDYSNSNREGEVIGNIQNFTSYKVHYVGQSTKQEIWKRLSGHHKLQDILSLENPISSKSLPAHEIILLFFHIQEHFEIKAIYSKKDEGSLSKEEKPSARTIYLDAEKALIKAMNPKYNDELFKNYPKSKDGLYKHNYSSIYYDLADSITLTYPSGKIEGSYLNQVGDVIQILNNNSIIIGKLGE